MRLREYCNSKGVKIIGDMPIYIGEKSCDVLSNPSLFELDGDGKMLFQSGCPPCEYNLDGQLWGTPTYRWRTHKETDYNWLIKRFNKLFEMVDIIRLDHFIGYLRYYRIPIGDTTAENGEWIDGPGHDLFINLKSRINNLNVIVEDLGDITQEVLDLRDKFEFPGMNVLQFEMESVTSLPDFPYNSLVCSGTHDNDTIMGWFKSIPHKNRKQILSLFW